MDSLRLRSDVTAAEMAQLEFAYIEVLDDAAHGIPNLEREITSSPLLFVQALALLCERSDDGQDPPAWHVDNADRRAAANAAYRLLQQVKRIILRQREFRLSLITQ